MSISEIASELVSNLAEKAEDMAPEVAAKGFDSLLDEGEDFLDGLEDEGLKAGGREALEILRKGKQPFVRLSVEAFGQVLGYFHSDQREKAKNVYIATQATYPERRKWMQEGGDLAQKEREERDAAWEEVKKVLQEVGTFGVTFLANLVFKSLGLPITL